MPSCASECKEIPSHTSASPSYYNISSIPAIILPMPKCSTHLDCPGQKAKRSRGGPKGPIGNKGPTKEAKFIQLIQILSQVTTPLPGNQPWWTMFPFTTLSPFHSIYEYEAFRHTLAEAGRVGNLKCDVDFHPFFHSMDEMLKFFHDIATHRRDVANWLAEPESDGKKAVHRIKCPFLTKDPRSDDIVECQTTNSRPTDMWRHMCLHTMAKDKKCPRCDHSTHQLANLKQHFLATHIKKPWAECDKCGEKFLQQADRSRHYRQVHDIRAKRASRGDAWQYTHKSKQAATRSLTSKRSSTFGLNGAAWGEDPDDAIFWREYNASIASTRLRDLENPDV